jgi:hypothetical protein
VTAEPLLTKLHIDLPNHWACGGEALWAESLGNDLYAIDNIPFFAYGLNYKDIVRARAAEPSLKPEIEAVVEPSGHRTLRIIFPESNTEAESLAFVTSLTSFGAGFENNNGTHFAIDIPPDGDYDGLCRYLMDSEHQGLLRYETGEARIPGSFDDLPSSGDDSTPDAS